MSQESTKKRLSKSRRRAELESVDDRMIALMRLTLAVSALVIIRIDPSEPDRFVALTYTALLVYVIYSLVIYLFSVFHRTLIASSIASWIDIGCYLIIIALSSGTNSVFFFFFFFSLLVASFRGGFVPGIAAALVSSILFTIIGYVTAPGKEFELNRFLLRPVYLLVLGYMMAYWGGREIKLKKRLALLREITNLSNPRFGVSYTIGSMLEKIQSFYDADTCLLVLIDPVYKDTRVFQLARQQSPEAVHADRVPEKLEELLLCFPEDVAIVHRGRSGGEKNRGLTHYEFDLTKQRKLTNEWQTSCDSVAAQLDLESFVSVPLHYRGKMSGRLYLTASRRTFGASDIDFLMQVVEQIIPVIHNIRLLAQRAFNAAEEERQRLARDVHDSVIQPYIGLQYRLAALRNKSRQGEATTEDIERLFSVTVNEIDGLRGFVHGLRHDEASETRLMASIRRFATQFSESYDLEVEVNSTDNEIEVSDQLAPQLLRIVQEGLSNVRKHTNASFCRITVERFDANVRLTIENNRATVNGGSADFVPRSIAERAEDLGGRVTVSHSLDDHTTVKVEIPM